MSKKQNKKINEEKLLETQDYNNFMSELNEIENSIKNDIKDEKETHKEKVVINKDDSIKKEEKVVEKVEEENKEEFTKEASTNSEPVKKESNVGMKPYFSFTARIYTTIILLLVAIGALSYFVVMSFAITKKELIKYNIKSDIDYKIGLKPNDFYDTPYLGKDMVYVASLIDKVNINYKYRFYINKDSDINFNYKIVAKLVIASQSNSNVFFEKEYDLTKETSKSMQANKEFFINEDAVVDYVYYNSLANKFRSKYAVNTNSYLDVYLVVKEENQESNEFVIKNESKAILTIPLSQQEINVALKNQEVDENKQLISDSRIIVKNYNYIFISFILIVIIIILIGQLIKKIRILTKKTSNYDSYVNRLLRGYDRIIVNIKTKPNFDNYNIIKVESFQELVDVRDNLKSPINYYVITEHQKCEFYVSRDNDVYTYIVKAIDLDKEESNER